MFSFLGKSVDLRAKHRLQQLEKDAGVSQPGVEMSQVHRQDTGFAQLLFGNQAEFLST